MKSKRQNQILQMLHAQQSLKTEDLAAHFSVSIETIRRDIKELANNGLVKKVYGGIEIDSFISRTSASQTSWEARVSNYNEEKRQIAARVLELVPDNSVIALDNGSTTYALSCLLGAKKSLSIVTNSLRIASELTQNTRHQVYLIGGLMNIDGMGTSGIFALDFISRFPHIDLYIAGCDGLTLENGVTENYEYNVDLKRALIDIVGQTILVTDSSKFGKQTIFPCFPLEKVNVLVTDSKAPQKMLKQIEQLGVKIVVS